MTKESSVKHDDFDAPRAVAALFRDEAAGVQALDLLDAAGITEAWLGVAEALKDERAFSVVLRQQGGSWVEKMTRQVFGPGNDSLYAVLIDHGVAYDVARKLANEMPKGGIVVIAGGNGDIRVAARVLEDAGGHLVRGDDAAAVGRPEPRRHSHEASRAADH